MEALPSLPGVHLALVVQDPSAPHIQALLRGNVHAVPYVPAEQVFAASDVQTVSGPIPSGGTATLVFSHQKDAGVLVMNNVPPPQPGTVYQMWLVGEGSPKSAGTMDATSVAPSTTAVLPDLGTSRALAFTVEPGSGSNQPTSPAFAELPLT